MVYRVYTEKKPTLASQANALLADIRDLLAIPGLEGVRILNRYDAENITKELFEYAIEHGVFRAADRPDLSGAVTGIAKPMSQTQRCSRWSICRVSSISAPIPPHSAFSSFPAANVPLIRTARIYILTGKLTDAELTAIKKYVINPVEAREASLNMPEHPHGAV